jgi:hypothetical protein
MWVMAASRRHVQTIVDNERVALRYYPRSRIVHHELRGFVHGQDFRGLLEKGLELFVKHRAIKWLSDDRANGPVKPEDSEWALTSWAPRVMAAGWKFWAVVMPEKVLGQMNMRRKIDSYGRRGITAKAFADPEEAMIWLEDQSVSAA